MSCLIFFIFHSFGEAEGQPVQIVPVRCQAPAANEVRLPVLQIQHPNGAGARIQRRPMRKCCSSSLHSVQGKDGP